jgi:hypothetical protein
MSEPGESMDQRRAHLAAEIARQRGELAEAYRNLAKPIQYTEYGLRGFGFLRANPWVLTLVPALVTVTSSVIGVVRNKPAKPAPRLRHKLEREAGREAKGVVQHLAKWGGRGWILFKFYRGVRRFLP